MKKSVLAAAALLAASGAAFAQSSVTLYGVVDLSVESVKGDDSITRVSSSNYATSRLGFKGVEDLGGGLKVKFTLESAVGADTGTAGSGSRFWDRAAWVGLDTEFGGLSLGRIDSAIGLLAGNSAILGAQGYDDFKIAKTFAGDTYRRFDNAITYSLPALVSGLTAQVQYTTRASGDESSVNDLGKGYSLNAQYAAGAFALGAGYINVKAGASGSYEDSAALAYGSYDFGVAKVAAYYNVDSRSTFAEQKRLLGAKVWVPLADQWSLMGGVSQVKNAAKSAGKDDATIVSLKLNYNLSKRTAVYGVLTTVDNEAGSNLGVASVATSAGEDSHGLAVGIRHSF